MVLLRKSIPQNRNLKAAAELNVIQQQEICIVEVIAKKISKKSLFKLLFIGFTVGLTIFSLLCGIAAIFGAETVQWNGVYRTGFEGLLYSIFMGPVLGIVFSCVIWLFLVPGLWIYSFFQPLKVSFKNTLNEQPKVV